MDTYIMDAVNPKVNSAGCVYNTVSKIVSDKYGIPRRKILNLPYCQRRARVVGNNFYYGEKISKKLFKNIEKALGLKLKHVYDEHESRCEINMGEFKALKTPCQ